MKTNVAFPSSGLNLAGHVYTPDGGEPTGLSRPTIRGRCPNLPAPPGRLYLDHA
jgi:hypothetical protein